MSAADAGTERFLTEVRAFLDRALTEDLRAAGRATTGVHSEIGACRLWHRRLYEQGWIAPAWPREHGGSGWSEQQRFLFDQECAANDAPILFAGGIRSLGPLLISMGTAEQKARYLPAILNGDDLWAQGFSETGAGSDLAAIATRAVAAKDSGGDHYVVDGLKLWTTGAHLCNRLFMLVRTAQMDKPQQGITFLIVDMPSPGLTITPIITMDGAHEFNEVRFEAVRVPMANRVGEENEGWAAAKRLMAFARSNNTNAAHLRRTWRALDRVAAATGAEAEIRARRTVLEIELVAFEALELRLRMAGRLDGRDEASSSLMKTAATELNQRIAELLLEAAGPGAAATLPLTSCLAEGGFAARKYLAMRAASIYSGTSEIHRGVMARHLMAWRNA